MIYSLYFEQRVTPDKKLILEMFFKDWVDAICNSEVRYYTVGQNRQVPRKEYDTIRLDFDNPEDAVIVKLRGVPEEFKNYLTLV